MKPFIYALGMADGKFKASSVLADLPFFIADPSGQYIVANYDNQYLGPMLYRKALANSRNVPAVRVLKKVGLSQAHAFMKDICLERSSRPASHYGLGLAVGGLYVRLLDLVRGYGILANGGREMPLNWFGDDVADDHSKQELKQVLPEDVCRQMALFLSDPLSRLPSFKRMGPLEYPFPVAVKTGTSQGFRDAWAVAWSGKYIVGVWIGHPNNERMKNVSGLSAASVVKRVMLHLHPNAKQGIGETPFVKPRGFEAVKLCTLSGQQSNEACSDVLLEYFSPSTRPVTQCGVHRQYAVDRRTGRMANNTTPSQEVEMKTVVTLAPEYSAWAASNGLEKPPIETKELPKASIEIRNPVHNAEIVLDPETPRQFQTLPLKAKVTPAIPHITWIVDGKPMEPTAYPYVFRWKLEPGKHTFQAAFPHASVRSEIVIVSVSEY